MIQPQKFIAAAALAALSITLINCSVKVAGGDGGPTSPPVIDVVRQQGLGGMYISDCITNPLGGMRTISLLAEPGVVTVEQVDYQGINCSSEYRRDAKKGTLEEIRVSGGYHIVKHVIPLGRGWSTHRLYKMRFSSDEILTSDAVIDEGDLKSMPANISLKRQGTPTPPPRNPPTQPIPPTPPPQNPGSIRLKSGDYMIQSGYDRACPQNIGTATQNQVVTQVFVTMLPPCSTWTMTVDCSSGVCEKPNRARITFLTEETYKYENLVDNWSAIFKRR